MPVKIVRVSHLPITRNNRSYPLERTPISRCLETLRATFYKSPHSNQEAKDAEERLFS